jgi:hypothetical protein
VTERAQVHAERSPTRCPFCHEELAQGKELVACAACGARHHASCHRDHGRCASCASVEVLVPPRRRRRDQPPAGSRLEVAPEGEATAFAWDSRTTSNDALALIFAVLGLTLPLAVWYLVMRMRHRRERIRLTPDAIELATTVAGGFGRRVVRIARADVGAVRVSNELNVHMLTIDEGITRHRLWTAPMSPALSAPELEWLAEQLAAWRDEA